MSNAERNIIDADPTKELFVFMLTRDLTLIDAIGDLIDNSTDGAKRMRPDENTDRSKNRLEPDGKYKGLTITIEANETKFSIIDNCGGIPANIARDYAFRFGRPKEMQETLGSVGQFGIGMKRALFKLGNRFKIESISATSRFIIEVDIEEWLNKKEWNFHFTKLEEEISFEESLQGTTITVELLQKDTSSSFKIKKFIDSIRREIEQEQLYNIYRGLQIIINTEPLQSKQLFLLDSQNFRTAYWSTSYSVERKVSDIEQKGELHVEIYAGVSEENTEHAGWYIFCNDRLIIAKDQTELTGWGELGETRIPKYHSQFNRFRGYVFFNSNHADLLPWNTAKNNMDSDNPYFKIARNEMIILMRPIIDFLNKVHDERQKIEDPSQRTLANALSQATPVALSKVTVDTYFIAPEPSPTNITKTSRITYSKTQEEVQKAKDFFRVETNQEVGIKTFDYWYEAEIES